MREGFTSQSRSTNKGLGLDTLLKTAVIRNGGEVTIYFFKEGIIEIVRPFGAGGQCKTTQGGLQEDVDPPIVRRADSIMKHADLKLL